MVSGSSHSWLSNQPNLRFMGHAPNFPSTRGTMMVSYNSTQQPVSIDLPADDESSWAICIRNRPEFIPRSRDGKPLRPLCGLQTDAHIIASIFNKLLDITIETHGKSSVDFYRIQSGIEEITANFLLPMHEPVPEDKVDGYEIYMINEKHGEECILFDTDGTLVKEEFSDPESALAYASRRVGEDTSPTF